MVYRIYYYVYIANLNPKKIVHILVTKSADFIAPKLQFQTVILVHYIMGRIIGGYH
jgi:hypothetical protein